MEKHLNGALTFILCVWQELKVLCLSAIKVLQCESVPAGNNTAVTLTVTDRKSSLYSYLTEKQAVSVSTCTVRKTCPSLMHQD